jgi:hypothetical protein
MKVGMKYVTASWPGRIGRRTAARSWPPNAVANGSPVCTENSDSDVLVVKPTDECMRRNTSDPLNRTRYRGILVQGTMRPRLIVITCVGVQASAQVLLPQRHHVVSAFAADGANQSFGKTILPRRSCRNRLVADAHGPQSAPDNRTVDPVAIADQIAWRLVPGECFGNLLRDPFGRRMGRHVDPDKVAACQPDHDKGIEHRPQRSPTDLRDEPCQSAVG